MLEYLKKEANVARTENGALTLSTTGSDCLDFFACVGALRNTLTHEIETRFARAYAENADLATKILFFARDVRGGLGERRVFRVIVKWLAFHNKATVVKNLPFVAEFGRYDDLICLLNTPCEGEAVALIRDQLARDKQAMKEGEPVSLLGKWLPSCNTSSHVAKQNARRLASLLGYSERDYRKLTVALRKEIRILENALRVKDYTFDYAKQPSAAMLKYRRAFLRNDEDRYLAFLGQVSKGEATMHTDTLAPYEILRPCYYDFWLGRESMSELERTALDVTWNALPSVPLDGNALVVVDGSGSMYGGKTVLPIQVAHSLALYFAERNEGAFAGHFITFSESPQLVKIKGKDMYEKVNYCASFSEVANTNVAKVFDLILSTAVKNKLSQSEMPASIYVVSDMEFDDCVDGAEETNFEYAKRKFEEAGYRLPKLVFWNVDSRNRQQPVLSGENGVALVSGCSPKLFEQLSRGFVDPYRFMMEVVSAERYRNIYA